MLYLNYKGGKNMCFEMGHSVGCMCDGHQPQGKPFVFKNKWRYDIIKNTGEGLKGYGYTLFIYKNGIQVSKQGSFGVESIVMLVLERYILNEEYNLELE